MRLRRALVLATGLAALAAAVPVACQLSADRAAGPNRPCYVCHAEFEGEKLSRTHARHGVACARCHGPSEAHQRDQTPRAKPDAVPRGEAFKPLCLECHTAAKVEKEGAHRSEAKRPAAERRSCLECHGPHKRTAPAAPPTGSM